VEVAAEKNSTLVLPFPVELLRFLDNATDRARRAPASEVAVPGQPAASAPVPDQVYVPTTPGTNAAAT